MPRSSCRAAAPSAWKRWRDSSPTGADTLVLRNGWFSYRWTQILDMGRIAAQQQVLKARPAGAGRQMPFAPPPIDEVVAAIARAAAGGGVRAACRDLVGHAAAR